MAMNLLLQYYEDSGEKQEGQSLLAKVQTAVI